LQQELPHAAQALDHEEQDHGDGQNSHKGQKDQPE
jgi:hypothetical protein